MRRTRSTGYVSEENLTEYLALLRRHKEQFEAAVQIYDFRDIGTQQGIREIAEAGLYPRAMQIRGTFVPVELRLEHLRNLVHMIEAHDRYQMALLDDRECEHIPTLPNRTITGMPSGGEAFLTTWLPHHQGKLTQRTRHLAESMLLNAFRQHFNAFRQHFEDAWERIAPPHKQQAEVLAWLRARIAALEQRGE